MPLGGKGVSRAKSMLCPKRIERMRKLIKAQQMYTYCNHYFFLKFMQTFWKKEKKSKNLLCLYFSPYSITYKPILAKHLCSKYYILQVFFSRVSPETQKRERFKEVYANLRT